MPRPSGSRQSRRCVVEFQYHLFCLVRVAITFRTSRQVCHSRRLRPKRVLRAASAPSGVEASVCQDFHCLNVLNPVFLAKIYSHWRRIGDVYPAHGRSKDMYAIIKEVLISVLPCLLIEWLLSQRVSRSIPPRWRGCLAWWQQRTWAFTAFDAL